MRTMLQRRARSVWHRLTAAVLLVVVTPLFAAPPGWWSGRMVVNPTAVADDFGVANLGQLKKFAAAAYDEILEKLPSADGQELIAMLKQWYATDEQGNFLLDANGARIPKVTEATNDYAAANIGQLKTVAAPAFRVLIAQGYATEMPWAGSAGPSNDFAAANLGQLKNVFSFDLQPPFPLSAASIGRSKVMLRWLKPQATILNFHILRRVEGATAFSQIGTTNGSAESYVDALVQPGVTYEYRVRARGMGQRTYLSVILAVRTREPFLDRNVSSDPDGLSDAVEAAYQTNPNLADTDGDGIDDGDEIEMGLDPINSDSDGDGVDDSQELSAGLDPRVEDSDGDRLLDSMELAMSTDPTEKDTDGDGVRDGDEMELGTDPLNPDSDEDGTEDKDDHFPNDDQRQQAIPRKTYVALDISTSQIGDEDDVRSARIDEFTQRIGYAYNAVNDENQVTAYHSRSWLEGATGSERTVPAVEQRGTKKYTYWSGPVNALGHHGGSYEMYDDNGTETDTSDDSSENGGFVWIFPGDRTLQSGFYYRYVSGLTNANVDSGSFWDSYDAQFIGGSKFPVWHYGDPGVSEDDYAEPETFSPYFISRSGKAVGEYRRIESSNRHDHPEGMVVWTGGTSFQPLFEEGDFDTRPAAFNDNQITFGATHGSFLPQARPGARWFVGTPGSMQDFTDTIPEVFRKQVAPNDPSFPVSEPSGLWFSALLNEQNDVFTNAVTLEGPGTGEWTYTNILRGSSDLWDIRFYNFKHTYPQPVVIQGFEYTVWESTPIPTGMNDKRYMAGRLIKPALNADGSPKLLETEEGDVYGIKSTSRAVFMLPFDAVTKVGEDDGEWVLDSIGVTDQPPTVKLKEFTNADVQMVDGRAVLTVSGEVFDRIADNVPRGQGADIQSVRIFVNGTEEAVVPLTQQADGNASSWRQYPYKGTFSKQIDIQPDIGTEIAVLTSPNLANLKGRDRAFFEFKRTKTSVTVPDMEISHVVEFPRPGNSIPPGCIRVDNMIWAGADEEGWRYDGPGGESVYIHVRGAASPLVDEIVAKFSHSGGRLSDVDVDEEGIKCTETGSDTDTFYYYEDISQHGFGDVFSFNIKQIVNYEPELSGTARPIKFRTSVPGGMVQSLVFKVHNNELKALHENGHRYLATDSAKPVVAYVIETEPKSGAHELVYFDSGSSQIKRTPINEMEKGLGVDFLLNGGPCANIALTIDYSRVVDQNGEEDGLTTPIYTETLRAFLDDDPDIQIDQYYKLQFSEFRGRPEIRNVSREISTDQFLLKVEDPNNPDDGKVAYLNEIAGGLFETRDKYVVYSSSHGQPLLTDQEWQELKSLGYICLHNTDPEAYKTTNQRGGPESLVGKAVDAKDMRFEGHQDHHIFNAFKGSKDPRHEKFWKEVFGKDFEVDRYTVPLLREDHAAFSKRVTLRWQAFINDHVDGSGKILNQITDNNGQIIKLTPDVVRNRVMNEMVQIAKDEKYYDRLVLVRPYPGRINGALRAGETVQNMRHVGSSLEDLMGIDGRDKHWFDDPVRKSRWKDILKVGNKRWGRSLIKKVPYVQVALILFTLSTAGTSQALADFLECDIETADMILSGQVTMSLNAWRPGESVQEQPLKNGGSVMVGQQISWSHFERVGNEHICKWVHEHKIIDIRTTPEPGVVDIYVVRLGAESDGKTMMLRLRKIGSEPSAQAGETYRDYVKRKRLGP